MRFAFLLSLIVLAGCADKGTPCMRTSDCKAPQICVAAIGRCVSLPPAPPMDMSMPPPDMSMPPPEDMTQVDLTQPDLMATDMTAGDLRGRDLR